MRTVLFLFLLLLLGACAGDGMPSEAHNAALVASDRTGNGVALGDGRFLTNWHVCLRYQLDETLGPDDYLIAYDDPGDGSEPYHEGAALTGSYCLEDDHFHYRTDPPVDGVCLSLSNLPRQQLRFDDREEVGLGTSAIVFAQKALDLCVISLAPGTARARPSLVIDTNPVRLGQEVFVAGYAGGANELTAEICHVTATTTEVTDPDQINPSDLRVPSFQVDCPSVAPGSSGSPVFDADTGDLLGLIWTGTTSGDAYTSGYVTAASAWISTQAGRPADQFGRLTDLIRDHARGD